MDVVVVVVVMEIVVAVEVTADGAVMKGRDSDVPHIQEEMVHSVVADVVVVVVTTQSEFQPEGGVIIYEMFDEKYL